MPVLLTLPSELIAEILRNLPDEGCLISAALTCRTLHSFVVAVPSIAADVVERKVGTALMPYSVVASLGASSPRPFEAAPVLLGKLYENPDQILSQYRMMPLKDVVRLGRFNDYVSLLVEEWAAASWDQLKDRDREIRDRRDSGAIPAGTKLVLSQKEKFRMSRAFYRYEIFVCLFRTRGAFDISFTKKRELFFAKHPPWENEQIASVHDCLEMRLAAVLRRSTAFQLEKSQGVNLERVGLNNLLWQTWLSQGLRFLQKVETEYFKTWGHVSSADVDSNTAQPWISISSNHPYSIGPKLNTKLKDYSDVDIESITPFTRRDDPDDGPFTIWKRAHNDYPSKDWVMNPKCAQKRVLCYVFWDLERIKRWDLGVLFDSLLGSTRLSTLSRYEKSRMCFPPPTRYHGIEN